MDGKFYPAAPVIEKDSCWPFVACTKVVSVVGLMSDQFFQRHPGHTEALQSHL